MTIPDEAVQGVMALSIPALIGWIWNTQQAVTRHEKVIERLDELINLLLQNRLKN